MIRGLTTYEEVAVAHPASPSTTETTQATPWRMLLLDLSAEDPKWLIATVAEPADVKPAERNEVGQVLPDDLLSAIAWASERTGKPVILHKISDLRAWEIAEVLERGEPLPPAAEQSNGISSTA